MTSNLSANGRPPFVAALLGLVALLAGCMHPGPQDPARVGPFFVPTNHAGDPTLGGMRRVVLLPLWAGPATPPESAAALDEVLQVALRNQNRFEVVALSREECQRRFHVEALASVSALPHDLLPALHREFAADAVLLVDLTSFQAYKPLILGFRAKLAAIDGTRLVWTFDNVFAADSPLVANAARHHFIDRDRSVPADLTPAVLQSPSHFAAYAATAMFTTLPPVTLPPPPPARK